MEHKVKKETVRDLWSKYKFVALVILIGVVLLAWPTGSKDSQQEKSAAAAASAQETEDLAQTEKRMTGILSKIAGVGELQLMLSVESGAEEHLALDTELSYSGTPAAPDDYTRRSTTVVVSGDDGDTPVVTNSTGPTYRGALVVCQGADNAQVKLAVTQAVAALTGLGSDRITVVRCQ